MSAQIRCGRVVVAVVAVVGATLLVAWSGLVFAQGGGYPIPAAGTALWAAGCRSLWRGNEDARRRLIAVLITAALLGAFATAVSHAAVAAPLCVMCGGAAALLAGSAVGTFLRHQRGAAC